MKKIGFTWYPKDWSTSDKVFELTLEERGLYREFIDMAMENNNDVKVNLPLFARRFNANTADIEKMMNKLKSLELIIFDKSLSVPSCQPRLNIINGARKGGEISRKDKPTVKPNVKPIVAKDKDKDKAKDKGKLKEIIADDFKFSLFNDWLNYRKDIKKEIKAEPTLISLAKRFKKEPHAKVKWVVESSIESGYQGLFWDNFKQQNNNKDSRRVSL